MMDALKKLVSRENGPNQGNSASLSREFNPPGWHVWGLRSPREASGVQVPSWPNPMHLRIDTVEWACISICNHSNCSCCVCVCDYAQLNWMTSFQHAMLNSVD